MIEGMIDVSDKPSVPRQAKASGLLHLRDETAAAISSGPLKKGDVLEASTIAAIQAVKDTPRIVPHCHPIPIEGCWVEWDWENSNLRCTVTVKAKYRTGVEMEALTGVSAGLLCAWDMVKSMEKDDTGQYPSARMTDIVVLEKLKG
ncbi:MAG: cyclic pyranopterin monophosphate synthase MoaC [Candidatus Poseidoniaceae archaeon]|jgi:cyclic pyranopterin phosphate synthase|nr:cyclic pyranopterin monophosphate synthase MoaC [Candidatus Poseidoniaceae archaeon]